MNIPDPQERWRIAYKLFRSGHPLYAWLLQKGDLGPRMGILCLLTAARRHNRDPLALPMTDPARKQASMWRAMMSGKWPHTRPEKVRTPEGDVVMAMSYTVPRTWTTSAIPPLQFPPPPLPPTQPPTPPNN